MTTVTIHGSRRGGRAVGKPTTFDLSSRDPIAVNRAARAMVQSATWQKQIAQSDRVKLLMERRARLPFAAGLVHVDGLLALAMGPPPPNCCYWCQALLVRDLGIPELPRDPANFALLGPGCQRCRTRWETAAVAARERALQAAGIRRPARRPSAATGTAPRKTLPSFYGSRRIGG
jgi:hypothetical protein